MEYTLKQLASLTGVTKQTCWRYVKKHNIDPMRTLENGAQVYSEETLQKLQKEYNSDITNKKNNNSSNVIEALQQQLAVKDEQIKELHRLLDQQQQLNLNTSRLLENKAQESHAEPQNDTRDNNSDNFAKTKEKASESTETTYKGNIFSRLFRNK